MNIIYIRYVVYEYRVFKIVKLWVGYRVLYAYERAEIERKCDKLTDMRVLDHAVLFGSSRKIDSICFSFWTGSF